MADDPGASAHALVAACRRLGEAMDLFDEQAAAELGVNRTDLRALNLLEHGALSAGQIGERLHLTSGSITTLVDRLVSHGYVTRQIDPGNRRRVLVELRPDTYAAFARVYRPHGDRVRVAVTAMPEHQQHAARVALDLIADTFAESRPDPGTPEPGVGQVASQSLR